MIQSMRDTGSPWMSNVDLFKPQCPKCRKQSSALLKPSELYYILSCSCVLCKPCRDDLFARSSVTKCPVCGRGGVKSENSNVILNGEDKGMEYERDMRNKIMNEIYTLRRCDFKSNTGEVDEVAYNEYRQEAEDLLNSLLEPGQRTQAQANLAKKEQDKAQNAKHRQAKARLERRQIVWELAVKSMNWYGKKQTLDKETISAIQQNGEAGDKNPGGDGTVYFRNLPIKQMPRIRRKAAGTEKIDNKTCDITTLTGLSRDIAEAKASLPLGIMRERANEGQAKGSNSSHKAQSQKKRKRPPGVLDDARKKPKQSQE